MHFGEHLTIDGYGGDINKLNDESLLKHCLLDLPEKLGMRILGGPYTFLAKDNEIKDPGGWTGFVVIMESHFSIHTFPKRGFVSIDAYTCKNGMDIEFIKNYFKEAFSLQDLETNFIKRGMKYPERNLY